MEPLHIIGLIVLAAIIAYLAYRFLIKDKSFNKLFRLPFQLLGLSALPAIPFSIKLTIEAAIKLAIRTQETTQALNGLLGDYTIQGNKANARSFLFGREAEHQRIKASEELQKELAKNAKSLFADHKAMEQRLAQPSPLPKAKSKAPHPLTRLFLEKPEQFSMGWTHYNHIYQDAQSKLPEYSSSLKVDADGAKAATRLFWPLIAHHGLAFNLLIPKKMPAQEEGPLAGKKRYQIDMRFFEEFETNETNGFTRFTPGAIIDLYQNPADLNLIPYRIQVFNYRGSKTETYEYGLGARIETTTSMWVYALQAAKAAVTVWGIWLGHVYHWHIVTGALQLTMSQQLKEDHPIRQLLDPISNYLIGFDAFLLLSFEHIAPPTSFKSGLDWMRLENAFAEGRQYHDDDPIPTLEKLGISQDDFTTPGSDQKWDQYPIVRYLLDMWYACEEYVKTYITHYYPNAEAVQKDAALHKWLKASRDTDDGNIMGIPGMNGPEAQKELIKFITSYVFRITAHGSSRMNTAANPALAFVANFPPCLQDGAIHPPTHVLSQEDLLRFLPNTGTIGDMLNFLFIFVFSAPYESLIPDTGIDQDLFFGSNEELNVALVKFRRQIERILKAYDAADPMIHQWPRNIET